MSRRKTPHVVTSQNSDLVVKLVADGANQTAIAGILEISVPTLKKYYQDELTAGREKPPPDEILPVAGSDLDSVQSQIVEMARDGMTWHDIAVILGLDESSMDYYEHLVERGRIEGKREALATIYRLATAKDSPNISALKMYLQTNFGILTPGAHKKAKGKKVQTQENAETAADGAFSPGKPPALVAIK